MTMILIVELVTRHLYVFSVDYGIYLVHVSLAALMVSTALLD